MHTTYTSDPSTMRAIHAYNRAAYRDTGVQHNVRPSGREAWMGGTLIGTDGDVWRVRIANDDVLDVPHADIRMALGA